LEIACLPTSPLLPGRQGQRGLKQRRG